MRTMNLGMPARFAMALLFALPVSTAALAEGATPFAQLAGSWHGGGQVKYNDGSNERLSCRGSYSQKSGGSELTLTIRCQSPSNKIDMKSDISSEGGRLSGHWSERNFGLEGDVDGSAGSQQVHRADIGSASRIDDSFSERRTHNVSISTNGPGFKTVSIAFSRG